MYDLLGDLDKFECHHNPISMAIRQSPSLYPVTPELSSKSCIDVDF